jgi:hypothetical protein
MAGAPPRGSPRRPPVKDFLTESERHETLDIMRTAGPDPADPGTSETQRRLASVLGRIGSASPLAALAAASELSAAAGDALQEAVDRARAAGRSWREIGDVLGTSRQAVFQRFGHPIDPRTGLAMSKEVPPGTAEAAMGIVASIAAGQWEEARRDFNDRMSQALSAAGLADAWARVASLFGSYEGSGEPFTHRAADRVIVEIPLRFEAADAIARIVFDADDRVAGLWFRPTET